MKTVTRPVSPARRDTIVAVSVLLAVQDPGMGLAILAAAIGVGQIVDQVIQPRLMGSIVGLQPAWLLIAQLYWLIIVQTLLVFHLRHQSRVQPRVMRHPRYQAGL